MTATNRFSAAGSALGYLTQIEYGLLMALQRMDEFVTFSISMETIDDIVFDDFGSGSPRELIQTKHHVGKRGSLGNSSPNIWKSIHNWIETAGEDNCILLSTATAPIGSAAALLTPERSTADVRKAQEILEEVARKKGNKELADFHSRFLDLDSQQRFEALDRLTIIHGAAQSINLTEEFIKSVRKTVPANRRAALVERLRGWWHGRALQHLSAVADAQPDRIDLEEIESQLHYIAQSLRDDSLPIDYDDHPEPSLQEIEGDDRIFVEQLKIIMLNSHRIHQAIYDHNRAFLQRSRWQREYLVGIGELDIYDRRLLQEWRRHFLPIDDDDLDTSDDAVKGARRSLVAMERGNLPKLRRELASSYVAIGSLHILADRMTIGWHPDWLNLLRHRLTEVQDPSSQPGVA